VPYRGIDDTWQLVQVGNFSDRSAAAEGAASLRRRLGLAALVMKSAPQ